MIRQVRASLVVRGHKVLRQVMRLIRCSFATHGPKMVLNCGHG